NVSIDNKFGSYSISFKIADNKINVVRSYERHVATYPPSDFTELAQFYDDMYKADRKKIVFVKKEG
ncbi:MAG: hypothetical protein ABI091_29675, partial [Ferruginibacter sp.]